LNRWERAQNSELRNKISLAESVNRENVKTIEGLEKEKIRIEDTFSEYIVDKEKINSVRSSLNLETQKVLDKDEGFKSWHDSRLDDNALRLFNEAGNVDSISDDRTQTPGGASSPH
jgi:hypothetical protein